MATYAQISGTQERTARVGLNVAKTHRLFVLVTVAASWAGAATADDAAVVPDSLRACAAIRSDSDRHACYDREMAGCCRSPRQPRQPQPHRRRRRR